jgi:hypothetical protein
MIDQLVSRYGVAVLANVGNCADWNVCKTGLINELRDNPNDCFVLHDLSAESVDGLRTRLPRFDAVVVLERASLPEEFLAASPKLNRAYPVINQIVQADPELIRAEGLPPLGLPPMSIFVRDRHAGAGDCATIGQVALRLRNSTQCRFGPGTPIRVVSKRPKNKPCGDLMMPLLGETPTSTDLGLSGKPPELEKGDSDGTSGTHRSWQE